MNAPDTATRSPRLVPALICCAVATLAVSALALGILIGALVWLQSGGPATDRAMATLLIVIAAAFLLPPTVLMWVALVRLTTRPPHGAGIMLGCLRAVGGLVLVVALPTLSNAGNIGVIGAVIGIALAFLGTAQLLSGATRQPAPQP